MKYILYLPLLIISFHSFGQKDTCEYDFFSNSTLDKQSQYIDIQALFEANRYKQFYVALITIAEGTRNLPVKVLESSQTGNDKIILFNNQVANFNSSKITIDTTELFTLIGDKNQVTFQAYDKSGAPFHTDFEILLVLFKGKRIVGFSVHGCNLIDTLVDVCNQYFIFPNNQDKDMFFATLRLLRNSKP